MAHPCSGPHITPASPLLHCYQVPHSFHNAQHYLHEYHFGNMSISKPTQNALFSTQANDIIANMHQVYWCMQQSQKHCIVDLELLITEQSIADCTSFASIPNTLACTCTQSEETMMEQSFLSIAILPKHLFHSCIGPCRRETLHVCYLQVWHAHRLSDEAAGHFRHPCQGSAPQQCFNSCCLSGEGVRPLYLAPPPMPPQAFIACPASFA